MEHNSFKKTHKTPWLVEIEQFSLRKMSKFIIFENASI